MAVASRGSEDWPPAWRDSSRREASTSDVTRRRWITAPLLVVLVLDHRRRLTSVLVSVPFCDDALVAGSANQTYDI